MNSVYLFWNKMNISSLLDPTGWAVWAGPPVAFSWHVSSRGAPFLCWLGSGAFSVLRAPVVMWTLGRRTSYPCIPSSLTGIHKRLFIPLFQVIDLFELILIIVSSLSNLVTCSTDFFTFHLRVMHLSCSFILSMNEVEILCQMWWFIIYNVCLICFIICNNSFDPHYFLSAGHQCL